MGLMNGYQRALVRGRVPILVAFLAAAAGSAWLLRDVVVEAGTDVLLDQADENLAYYNQSRADWGTDEYLIVCLRRTGGWVTPDSLALLREILNRIAAAPFVKRTFSILDVPLLRNAPVAFMPVPVRFLDKDGALNPKVNLDKARAELLQHTQARGNLIAGERGEDLSILVYLDVPEDLLRL